MTTSHDRYPGSSAETLRLRADELDEEAERLTRRYDIDLIEIVRLTDLATDMRDVADTRS